MSKPKTYPIVEQKQAEFIRKIYKSINPNSGHRTLGAANSDISTQLFPASPFHSQTQNLENDRGQLLTNWFGGDTTTNIGPLNDENVSKMFATIVDGTSLGGSHVKKEADNEANVNWLYRDKPMDMNFAYLDKDGIPQAPSGAGVESEPGGNETITSLGDQPHWGYPNINVINNEGDTFSTNPQRTATPSIEHASNGFGTPVERPFSTRELIGTYFTRTQVLNQRAVLGSVVTNTSTTTTTNEASILSGANPSALTNVDAQRNSPVRKPIIDKNS